MSVPYLKGEAGKTKPESRKHKCAILTSASVKNALDSEEKEKIRGKIKRYIERKQQFKEYACETRVKIMGRGGGKFRGLSENQRQYSSSTSDKDGCVCVYSRRLSSKRDHNLVQAQAITDSHIACTCDVPDHCLSIVIHIYSFKEIMDVSSKDIKCMALIYCDMTD
jgi:hypothetical protein